jgi:hypothetical protein
MAKKLTSQLNATTFCISGYHFGPTSISNLPILDSYDVQSDDPEVGLVWLELLEKVDIGYLTISKYQRHALHRTA